MISHTKLCGDASSLKEHGQGMRRWTTTNRKSVREEHAHSSFMASRKAWMQREMALASSGHLLLPSNCGEEHGCGKTRGEQKIMTRKDSRNTRSGDNDK